MGFLKFFAGKTPEQIEKKADSLFNEQEYGMAKMEYENALAKLEKQSDPNPELVNRISEKLIQCKELLAVRHLQNAKELVASNCLQDAKDLLKLALELTADEKLSVEIQEVQKQFMGSRSSNGHEKEDRIENNHIGEDNIEEDMPWEEEEYLTALLGSLPQSEQEAYLEYGKEFKIGFVALNQGDFSTAVQNLSIALKAHSSAKSYIPLELATAYVNQGQYSEAESLLAGFLKDFPESIRACQLMSEILWEKKKFKDAEVFLKACPKEIVGSIPIQLLLGETYFLSGDLEKASTFYQDVLQKNEWDNHIAQSLAKTYEALGRNEEARHVYGQIIGACQGCGRKIDSHVKQRYAETSFKAGDFSTKTLELFFNLTQEDPENRSHYYHKISRIYSLQGNEKEAERFLSLAR